MLSKVEATMQTLTEKELAEMLRCSVAALRRMRREHRGPVYCKLGRMVRYPSDFVRVWLEQNASVQNKADTEAICDDAGREVC